MTTRRVPFNRRQFLYTSTAAASGLMLTWTSGWGAPASRPRPRRISPGEKLNLAAIGAGGQAATDINGVATENIVALCDVDRKRLEERGAKFPKARLFSDYRKMLEEMPEIDAVTVSTPDHHHAFASIMAMKLGKHVYCQKPLAHSVWEARQMLEVARATKVVTQMGNQGHSYDSTRELVELVQAGALGDVREVHVWTDRPIWPQGMERPTGGGGKPPETLDWDKWLGPAPWRPFHDDYLPFKWRGWWDYGTGAPGDMGCHNSDAAFWALKLAAPLTVEAESSGVNRETAPKWSIVRSQFGKRGKLPPVQITWYDGGKLPEASLVGGEALPKNGTIMVGSKGTIVFRDWNPNGFRVLPEAQFKDAPRPKPSIARANNNPYQEWIAACKGGPPCLSNFEYAVPLTEFVLLGNVALRVGKKIEWDPKRLRAKNCPEADQYIRREYRKGWELETA
jgi:predicted dehydrogenase